MLSDAAGLLFSQGTLVSSTNKADCHNIIEILLKVAVKHCKPNQNFLALYNVMGVSSLNVAVFRL
jgi:hypothetical protein